MRWYAEHRVGRSSNLSYFYCIRRVKLSSVGEGIRTWTPAAILGELMADICPICEGSGLRVVERPGGLRVAEPCECREARKQVRMIERARIPQRYAHCTLESFETQLPWSDRSQARALVTARNFVREYLPTGDGTGLLLTGSIGVGKTHLAVGILQSLITERGSEGFVL